MYLANRQSIISDEKRDVAAKKDISDIHPLTLSLSRSLKNETSPKKKGGGGGGRGGGG